MDEDNFRWVDFLQTVFCCLLIGLIAFTLTRSFYKGYFEQQAVERGFGNYLVFSDGTTEFKWSDKK